MAYRVSIKQKRPPLYLITNVMVVVAAHRPCQGRAVECGETSLARPVTFVCGRAAVSKTYDHLPSLE